MQSARHALDWTDMPTELEDRFIRYAREAAKASSRSLMKSSCPEHLLNNFKIAGYTYGFEVLTPRGLDLFLTAEHVGYDPDAKAIALQVKPPTQTCGTCKGEGRVPVGQLGGRDRTMKELVEGPDARGEQDTDSPLELPGWDVTCGTCKGAKVVPVRDAHAAVDMFFERTRGPGYKPLTGDYTLAWHDPASLPSSEPAASEWIDFTCLADVEGWEGATVEASNRDGSPAFTCRVTEVCSKFSHPVLRFEGGRACAAGVGWQFRKLW